MADNSNVFLPADDFPDDLDPQATLEVLDERLTDPTTPAPDLVVTDTPADPLGRSWAFDFGKNRFVTRASGVAATHGLGTLKTWVEKTLRTARGAHPIHSDDYGMERPFDVIGMPLSMISSQDIEQRVLDAILLHPLITGLSDFHMDYDPLDTILNVSFTVLLEDDVILPMNLTLP